jgi:TolA-binding protein
MTTCTWIDRDEVFEDYVRDALSPEDRDAFEEHFFSCETCFDKVQTYQALRAELSTTVAEAPAAPPAWARQWRWALVPVAAGLFLLAALAMWLRAPAGGVPEATVAVAPAVQPSAAPAAAPPATPPVAAPGPAAPQSEQQAPTQGRPAMPASRPVVALSVLARVEPPVYIPVTLRGPRDEAAEKFDDAMRHYVEGDYAGAIPELTAAAGLNPNAPRIAFFLAICDLLTSRLDTAIAGFQKTIARGESPYLEEAHFYLAKARLRQGDVRAARSELLHTIERQGRLEAEARRLVSQLDRLPAGKDRPPGE